jgi:hypothetical protein
VCVCACVFVCVYVCLLTMRLFSLSCSRVWSFSSELPHPVFAPKLDLPKRTLPAGRARASSSSSSSSSSCSTTATTSSRASTSSPFPGPPPPELNPNGGGLFGGVVCAFTQEASQVIDPTLITSNGGVLFSYMPRNVSVSRTLVLLLSRTLSSSVDVLFSTLDSLSSFRSLSLSLSLSICVCASFNS